MITGMPRSLVILACVAIGGAIGAMARHGVSLVIVPRAEGPRWPATLAVNLLGCLLIGVLWRVMEHHATSATMRALVITGILGGFTTFSAFGLDVLELLEGRRAGLAALYVGASVGAGVLLLKLGHDLTGALLGATAAAGE